MDSDVIYTTVDQQIDELLSKNLVIDDVDLAKYTLQLYGYTSVIKNYREIYLVSDHGEKRFRNGIRYEQILSLYQIDRSLRGAVISAMLDFEDYIKAMAADIIARDFGTDHHEYLKSNNYSNKKRHPRFSRKKILEKITNAINTDKGPVKDYMDSFGIVPPWILFKSIFMGTIVNYIDLFKAPQQSEMAERVYGERFPSMQISSKRKLMMDTLFIAYEFRNLAAHGGKIYNHTLKKELRIKEIFGDIEFPSTGFRQLLELLNFIEYRNPFNLLQRTLNNEINRHCSVFPEDATYLSQILNVNIEKHTYVYVNRKSNIYHLSPICSGMNNPIQYEYDDAVSKGFVPCKRCVKK